jgi:membrane protease YdiL (CAAX protease family)
MQPLVIVLCFPLILTAGYGLAYFLSGRNRRFLLGPAGFVLYLALLAIPLVAVIAHRPALPGEVLTWGDWTAVWLVAGLAAGLVLWGAQFLLQRRGPVEDVSPIWVGPPGWAGFLLLMVPVAYIVVAEELVWRGFLLPALGRPAVGLPLSSLAFALHHYHFGARHVVFSLFAGLVWGVLFLASGDLWPAVVSHLSYDALAWGYLRRRAAPSSAVTGPARRS